MLLARCPQPLSSPSNPLVQRLARLGEARWREEQALFLVEGLRAITEFLAAGWSPVHLLLDEALAVPATWPEKEVQRATQRVISRVSQASTPSGYCAAFALPHATELDQALGGLVLAGLGDPGNTGTLIRTAAAFGIRQVLLLGGADPYGPKAVQASAGALARCAIHRLSGPPAAAPLSAPWCALVPRGGVAPETLPRQARFLVVGGEAHGLEPQLRARCTEQVTLPMPGGTESLNAAIAGSIAGYLLLRAPA